MDVTVKANGHVMTGATDNGIFQCHCKGFLQECADVVVQEGRTKVQHVLLDDSVCTQLALCDLNCTECRCDLLRDLAVDSSPRCSLHRMVIEDPSGQILDRLEVDLCKQRMLCNKIFVDILNDGSGHDLITEQACISLYRIPGLTCINESLIELGFFSSQLTETTLCKDVSVTIGRLKVSQDSCGNGLSKLLKGSLHNFRCGILSVECSLKGCGSFCNHRILSQHFLNLLS